MKKIISSLICVLMLFVLAGCSGLKEGAKDGYNDSTKYTGINVKDIKEETVKSGSGSEIGKRGTVTYNPDKITDESLSNFYKDKIKDSGYKYYTLVNEKDKTQGIVSAGCINILTYGSIDDTGSIVKSEKDFTVK